MANQKIVEINGKKYVRFNRDEQPNVKVGDVVTFLEESEYIKKGSECRVVKVSIDPRPYETLLHVECPEGKLRMRFHWRFGVPLVEEDIVVCKDAKGTKLAFGISYKVVDRKPGYLRVNGFGVWFKESRFVKQGEQLAIPVPKVDEHQKNLTELVEKVGRNPGTASYRVVHTDGEVSDHVNDVCHARLFSTKRWGEFKQIKAIYLNFSGHCKMFATLEDRVLYAQFLDYVVNESPWKSAFIPRKKEDLVNDGVALDVTKGKNLLVSAAIACRVASEYHRLGFLREWGKLVEAGCGKNLAFVTASLACYINVGNHYSPGDFSGGHHVFSDLLRVEDLSMFFNKGVWNNQGEIVTETKKSNYEVFALIGKEGKGNSLKDFLFDKFKHLAVDVWGGKKVTIKKHPVYGLAPLAFALSSIIK